MLIYMKPGLWTWFYFIYSLPDLTIEIVVEPARSRVLLYLRGNFWPGHLLTACSMLWRCADLTRCQNECQSPSSSRLVMHHLICFLSGCRRLLQRRCCAMDISVIDELISSACSSRPPAGGFASWTPRFFFARGCRPLHPCSPSALGSPRLRLWETFLVLKVHQYWWPVICKCFTSMTACTIKLA